MMHFRPQWGNFSRFLEYTHTLNWYLPAGMIPTLGITATGAESLCGLLLLVGWHTRVTALLLLPPRRTLFLLQAFSQLLFRITRFSWLSTLGWMSHVRHSTDSAAANGRHRSEEAFPIPTDCLDGGILCHSYCSAHGTSFANFHCTGRSYQTVKSHSGNFRGDARYW
jgi:hypothetical protein